jgi:hypothetical protein
VGATRRRRATLVIAVFNTVLLAGAGAAWGWDNIALVVVLLVTAAVLFTPERRSSPGGRSSSPLSLLPSESGP